MTDPDPDALERRKPEGWSTRTVQRPWKFHRDEVEPLLASLAFDGPTVARTGSKVNREAWDPETGWKVGVEESMDERGSLFRAMAENEGKGIRVRVPPRLVDELRARICPAAPGRSE